METGLKHWSKLAAGLSAEELHDLEKAKAALENYKNVYNIFEYSSELNENIQNLEVRITSNNPVIPMNIYRKSNAAATENLISEMELYMYAYFNLMDQCNAFPDWQRKLRKELGSQVSYLAKQIDEDSHKAFVTNSEVFKRFDDEKQLFFK